MTFSVVPPALILLAGAVLLPLLPRRARPAFGLVLPLAALWAIATAPEGARVASAWAGYELVWLQMDRLSRIFAAIFAIITFIGGLYAWHSRNTAERVAALLYGAGSLGVALAGDFLTLILFWELMALSSVFLVWARKEEESQKAGSRYLYVHLFGGSVLLAGIVGHFFETGSLALEPMTPGVSVASWFILIGVGLNAAIPPLHAWLADAYPRATVTGAVFMSALTTKSAVYVLARLFPGWEVLTWLGVAMALYGVFYAVLSNDIRELLAYHIISQVGYMVAGVGMGTETAINGTTAHAFSHILYKALLFMGAGAVLQATGRSKLTELGGLAKAMPWTLTLYMIGAFSISGFPLFNGFISKSMVVYAAAETHRYGVMMLLHLASIGTFLHTGLKLPYFTWFGTDRKLTPLRIPANMYWAMGAAALLCVGTGILPSLLYRHLPYEVHYAPYTAAHLMEASQLLVFTFIGFWIVRGKLAGEPTLSLDTDWFYRRPARMVKRIWVEAVDRAFDAAESAAFASARTLARLARNPAVILPSARLDESYDPDLRRGATESLIAFVLLVLVVAAVWGLMRAA